MVGSIRHDAPIEPMKIYYVNPHRIDRTVTWTRISADRKSDEHPGFQPPKYRLAGRVFGGEWDRRDDYVTESTIYRSFVDHFVDDVPWEETEFYEETLAAIEKGAKPWDCASRSDLDKRCAYLQGLYDRIALEGYKTQEELHETGDPTTSPFPAYRTLWDEIAVSVGRDGELIFVDGRNRFVIARILGLDEVPVVILVRHEEWQRKRNRVVQRGLSASDVSDDHSTHPDLLPLI